MARQVVRRRIPEPDPRFGEVVVSRFVNHMMYQGKRSTALRMFYEAMDLVAEKSSRNPVELFKEALEQLKPRVEVKSRRVGGANYQVPIEIRGDRREALGMKWLLEYARKRSEKGMPTKLANEVLDAFNQRGEAFRKKEDTHRMAEANKAFAHYRW